MSPARTAVRRASSSLLACDCTESSRTVFTSLRPSTTRSSNAYFPSLWVGGDTLSPSPPAGTSFTTARSADIPLAQELNSFSQSSLGFTEFFSYQRRNVKSLLRRSSKAQGKTLRRNLRRDPSPNP